MKKTKKNPKKTSHSFVRREEKSIGYSLQETVHGSSVNEDGTTATTSQAKEASMASNSVGTPIPTEPPDNLGTDSPAQVKF